MSNLTFKRNRDNDNDDDDSNGERDTNRAKTETEAKRVKAQQERVEAIRELKKARAERELKQAEAKLAVANREQSVLVDDAVLTLAGKTVETARAEVLRVGGNFEGSHEIDTKLLPDVSLRASDDDGVLARKRKRDTAPDDAADDENDEILMVNIDDDDDDDDGDDFDDVDLEYQEFIDFPLDEPQTPTATTTTTTTTSSRSVAQPNASESTTTPMPPRQKLIDQAEIANAGLAAYFNEVHQLAPLGATGHHGPQTTVRASPGPDGIDWAKLNKTVQQVAPPPPAGTHATVQLRHLETVQDGIEALAQIRALVQPLINCGYRVLDCFIKIRTGDKSPMHQDKQTGQNAFLRTEMIKDGRFHENSVPALRVLINIGTYTDAQGARPMVWQLKDGTELLRSEARVLAMDPNAAGCNARSNVLHGRWGDGITVSLDLVLPLLVMVGPTELRERLWRGRRGNFIIRWLHNKRIESELLRLSRLRSMFWKRITTEALERFESLSQQGLFNVDEAHCSRCGTSDLQGTDPKLTTRRVVAYGGVPHERRLCTRCTSDYNHIVVRANKQRMALLARFVSHTTCALDCVGCQRQGQRWEKSVRAAVEARPTAQERMQERAEVALSAMRSGSDVADSGEKHCWNCGGDTVVNAQGHAQWYYGGPDESRIICKRCDWALSNASEPMRRTFTCTSACTGCLRVVRLTIVELARARARAALAALKTTEPKASEKKHCWFCGDTNTAKWLNIQVDGVAHFKCTKCNNMLRKQPTLERVYNCPASCTGCIAKK